MAVCGPACRCRYHQILRYHMQHAEYLHIIALLEARALDLLAVDEGPVRRAQVLDEDLVAALGARGHQMQSLHHSAVVQVIRIDAEGGSRRLLAASDPRKGGLPAGR